MIELQQVGCRRGTARRSGWLASRAAEATVLSLFVLAAPASSQSLLRLDEGAQGFAVSAPARSGPGPLSVAVQVDLDLVRSGAARLELPVPDGGALVAERSAFEDRGDGDAVWYGRLPGEGYDSVVLTVEEGSFVGRFGRPGGGRSRIGAGADGRGRMIHAPAGGPSAPGLGLEPFCGVDAVAQGFGRDAAGALAAGLEGVPAASTDQSEPDSTLDLMVLYTATAASNWEGLGMAPRAAVRNAVDYLNMVFRNGRMGREARLVHVGESPAELDRVARDGMGVDSSLLDRLRWNGEVHRLHSEHGADIVHLFTGESPFLLGYGGVANLLVGGYSARGFGPLAYGVTANSLVPDPAAVFVHEVGHNLGAHHEPLNAVSAWRYAVRPYAFGHVDTRRLPHLGTSMSYGGQIEPYFSSVRIRPWGRDMGVAGERDNERAVKETLGLASQYSEGLFRPVPGAPSAPSGLGVELTSHTSLRVTWVDNSANEDRFVVTAVSSGFRREVVAPAGSEKVDLEDLKAGLPYFVSVTAYDGEKKSLRSGIVPIVLPGSEPPAATGVSATVEDPRTVRVAWDHEDPGSLSHFEVRVFRGEEFVRRVGAGASKMAASIDRLEPGVRFGVRVDAHSPSGGLTPGAVVEFELPAPEIAAAPFDVAAEPTGPNSVRVTWTSEPDGEDGFLVEARMARGAGWSGEFLFPAGSRSGEVRGLVPGGRYFFRVAPYAGSLDGLDRDGLAFSHWAAAGPGSIGIGPRAPSDLRFDAGPARLRWRDNSDDELGFEIQYRAADSEPDRAYLDQLALHSWERVALVDTGVDTFDLGHTTSSRRGRYRVFAYNADGFSESSNSVGAGVPGIQGLAHLRALPAGPGVRLDWAGDWTKEEAGRISVEQRSQGAGWFEVATSPAAAGTLELNRPLGVPYTFRLAAVMPDGSRRFSEEASAMAGTTSGPCRDTERFLCLRNRFEVQVNWTDPDDISGFGRGVATPVDLSDESGLFWFFDQDNVELVVKVLDGRTFNGNYWVFFGALTDVEYWVTVRDTMGGGQRTYHNGPKEMCGQRDIFAFSETTAVRAALAGRLAPPRAAPGVDLLAMEAAQLDAAEVGEAVGNCAPGAERLCLLDGRFAVEVRFVDPSLDSGAGSEAAGQVLPALTTRNSGFFWFFSDTNLELVTKILDGRAVNGRFWFLYGGLSDVAYTTTVTDMVTGSVATYINEAGSFCGGIDIEALD